MLELYYYMLLHSYRALFLVFVVQRPTSKRINIENIEKRLSAAKIIFTCISFQDLHIIGRRWKSIIYDICQLLSFVSPLCPVLKWTKENLLLQKSRDLLSFCSMYSVTNFLS